MKALRWIGSRVTYAVALDIPVSNALLLACNQILQNLKTVTAKLLGNDANAEQITFKQEKVYLNGEATAIEWGKLISQAYLSRTALSAHAHYATPGVYFDRTQEKELSAAAHLNTGGLK